MKKDHNGHLGAIENNINRQIVETINKIMEENHWSQTEMAKHLGVTQQFLCDVLHDRRSPGRIADRLGFRKVTEYVRKEK